MGVMPDKHHLSAETGLVVEVLQYKPLVLGLHFSNTFSLIFYIFPTRFTLISYIFPTLPANNCGGSISCTFIEATPRRVRGLVPESGKCPKVEEGQRTGSRFNYTM